MIEISPFSLYLLSINSILSCFFIFCSSFFLSFLPFLAVSLHDFFIHVMLQHKEISKFSTHLYFRSYGHTKKSLSLGLLLLLIFSSVCSVLTYALEIVIFSVKLVTNRFSNLSKLSITHFVLCSMKLLQSSKTSYKLASVEVKEKTMPSNIIRASVISIYSIVIIDLSTINCNIFTSRSTGLLFLYIFLQ